jgi:hypothetical protein
VSDQISPRLELCANVRNRVPCGHSRESHYEEAIPALMQAPGGPRTHRGSCLCSGCECALYVAPGT